MIEMADKNATLAWINLFKKTILIQVFDGKVWYNMLKLWKSMIDYEDNLEEAQTHPRPNLPAKKINFGQNV